VEAAGLLNSAEPLSLYHAGSLAALLSSHTPLDKWAEQLTSCSPKANMSSMM